MKESAGGRQVEVIYLEFGCFVRKSLVIYDQIVGDDQLVLGVTSQQRTVNLLLRAAAFLTDFANCIRIHNGSVHITLCGE